MEAAANGKADELDTTEEQDALDFLLSNAGPLPHKVPVTIATDQGDKTLNWRVRQLDGRLIEKIEDRNRKGAAGPLAEFDDMRVNAELIAEATLFPDVRSESFRTPKASDAHPNPAPDADPADAIVRVFRYQSGLLAGLAGEIRRISGWSTDRVGQAQRLLVEAAGNS